jgi:type VI secretion system protein ImpH
VLDAIQKAPHAFDLFNALRRIECAFPQQARLGQGLRPSHEPLRLGQEASLAFASSSLARCLPARGVQPARLLIHSFGLLGPSGPLPLHLTEFTRDRVRNAGDPTFARFLDIFHHRALSLFYRAWANSQPTVGHDRPTEDRFVRYLGAICGLGTRPRQTAPNTSLLYFAGRLAAQPRNAEGLLALLHDFLGLPVSIEPFVGEWLPLSSRDRWHLGRTRGLGQGTVLGARTWQRQHKFRLVVGPLDETSLRSLLPGGSRLAGLQALVKRYVGPAMAWDLRLRLAPQTPRPPSIGQGTRLGWTTWLGTSTRRQDVIFDPSRQRRPVRPDD